MSSLVVVTSAQFRPSHATLEMEAKLRKIAQLYWAIQLGKEELAKTPTGVKAMAIQILERERAELIRTLPLFAVQ